MGFVKYLFKRISLKGIIKGIGEFLVIIGLGILFIFVPYVSFILLLASLIWSGSSLAMEIDTTNFTQKLESQLTFKESISISMGVSGVIILAFFAFFLLWGLFGDWIKGVHFDYRREKEYKESLKKE